MAVTMVYGKGIRGNGMIKEETFFFLKYKIIQFTNLVEKFCLNPKREQEEMGKISAQPDDNLVIQPILACPGREKTNLPVAADP